MKRLLPLLAVQVLGISSVCFAADESDTSLFGPTRTGTEVLMDVLDAAVWSEPCTWSGYRR